MSQASSNYVAADGNGYELQMGRWSRRLAGPFLEFVGLRDDERVIDVGCGTGSLSEAVASRVRVRELVGVDMSPAYVEHARRHLQDARVTYEVGDATAMRFPDASFDRVLSLLMLHFVPRADAALAEMRRVARPGATIGAAVWDNRGGTVSARLFWDTAAALLPQADAQRARHCTRPMTRPDELADAFRAVGVQEVAATSLVIRMEFASFDDYWAPYEGRDGPVAAFVATLPADDRARLRDAVRAAYVDGEPDGPRSYASIAWAARGVAPR
jgi:ubiquinone/menaquinone biosynthesis C-methylase UbiE